MGKIEQDLAALFESQKIALFANNVFPNVYFNLNLSDAPQSVRAAGGTSVQTRCGKIVVPMSDGVSNRIRMVHVSMLMWLSIVACFLLVST